jgi:hypothetical protein
MKNYPLRKTKCATCPFRPGSKYACLANDLAASAMNEGSRICHSTGSNGIHKRTGIKSHLCRGARDVQLQVMFSLKVITAPTDEAWNAQREAIGMKPTEVKDPEPKGKTCEK